MALVSELGWSAAVVLAGIVMMTLSSCNRPAGEKGERVNTRQDQSGRFPVTLVIHGGAGHITRENMTPELERIYQSGLKQALTGGYEILAAGGSSVDAVVASIRVMEDSPWFNAGRGSVLTHEGTLEMDASLMDGGTGLAGAVAGVRTLRNPIAAAHRVMTRSPYVMLIGRGAEAFAGEQGLEIVEPGYFHTRRQLERLRKHLQEQGRTWQKQSSFRHIGPFSSDDNGWFGTVGAVALDRSGNIAAGTSTGGTIGKRYGRVGDSAVIGAGTYADNETCGISATGHGEFFIRNVVAYDIAARMKYLGQSLQKAAGEVIGNKLKKIGGSGGVVGLDRQGHIVMEFNTAGMYRGYIKEKGQPRVFLFEQ